MVSLVQGWHPAVGYVIEGGKNAGQPVWAKIGQCGIDIACGNGEASVCFRNCEEIGGCNRPPEPDDTA